jgi:hypothetical protein
MVTLMTMVCSVQRIVVGGDQIGMNSGELLREEIHRFALLRAPLDVWLLPNDAGDEVLLPSHSMGSGVVRIDGTVMNSGDVCRWSGGQQRGIEGE